MSKTKSWFILGSICVSLLITSCVQPSPTPNPLIEVYPANQYQAYAVGIAMFWEDFEDGDFTSSPRWQTDSSNVTYDRRVVFQASGDDHFLLLEGPQEEEQGHDTGLHSSITVNSIIDVMFPNHNGYKPNKVSFNIFAWPPQGNTTGAFLLKGFHPADDSEVTAIEFFIDKNGEFFVNGSSYGPISQHWHLIEFSQIYWDPDQAILPKFNLYIDNTLAGECLDFLAPIKGFYTISVYNFHRGHTGYDNIMMINEVNSEAVAGCGPGDPNLPPAPPPQPPPPEADDPSAFIATAKLDAACRGDRPTSIPKWISSKRALPLLCWDVTRRIPGLWSLVPTGGRIAGSGRVC